MERRQPPDVSFTPTSAAELLEHIRQAPYDSTLRKLPRTLPRLALSGVLSPDQVDEAMAAIATRRSELVVTTDVDMPSDVGPASQEVVAGVPTEWTPTSVLDRMRPVSEELDWMQRQVPNGDRD